MSLASIAQYRMVTNDLTTEDYKVTSALADAQNQIEEFCQREFDQAQRTETLRLYPNGRVYPKAFPLVSVLNMAGAMIDGWAVLLGYGYQWATTGLNPFVSGFGADTWAWTPQITMTYTGGYAPGLIPPSVTRAACQVTYDLLHPVMMAGVPTGATSITVGDTSISGPFGSIGSFRPHVRNALMRYRRPQVVSF